MTRKELIELALSEETPVETLIELAKSENVKVLEAVAYNPNTPPDILANLSKYMPSTMDGTEDEWHIIVEVACNFNIPPEVLGKLGDCYFWMIRHCVADNPNTPLEMLLKLAEDEVDCVRETAKKTLTEHGKK